MSEEMDIIKQAMKELIEQRGDRLVALKDMVIQYGGMADSLVTDEAREAVEQAKATIELVEKL